MLPVVNKDWKRKELFVTIKTSFAEEARMDFKGQVAIVTGGGRGIGRAIAEGLAKKGVNVAIADINLDAVNEAVTAIAALGVKAVGMQLDVSNSESVKKTFDDIRREFNRIDILINNAGITKDNLLIRMKEEDWDSVVNINLKSVFLCSREAIKDMSKQRYGRIVSISSIAAFMGNAGQANYSASKAGIVGLTKTIAKEYASRGITANAVAPGFIKTAMTDILPENVKEEMIKLIPAGRFGTVEDVANAVIFLASPDSDYITGHIIHVNGGMYM